MAIGAEQVASLSAKSNVNLGTLVIQQSQGPFFDGAAQADFFTIPGSMLGEWLAGQYRGFSMGLSPQVSQGSCIGTAGFSSFSPPLFPTLDAGALTITVPSGTKALPELPGPPAEYVTTLGFNDGLQNPLIGGTYAFSGAGGKDVGAFTATLKFPIQESFTNLQGGPPSMQISASGQTITWTGGAVRAVRYDFGQPIPTPASRAMLRRPPGSSRFHHTCWCRWDPARERLTVQVSAYPQSVSATGLDAAFLFGFVEPQTVNVTYY
jgi:hypothetical protein